MIINNEIITNIQNTAGITLTIEGSFDATQSDISEKFIASINANKKIGILTLKNIDIPVALAVTKILSQNEIIKIISFSSLSKEVLDVIMQGLNSATHISTLLLLDELKSESIPIIIKHLITNIYVNCLGCNSEKSAELSIPQLNTLQHIDTLMIKKLSPEITDLLCKNLKPQERKITIKITAEATEQTITQFLTYFQNSQIEITSSKNLLSTLIARVKSLVTPKASNKESKEKPSPQKPDINLVTNHDVEENQFKEPNYSLLETTLMKNKNQHLLNLEGFLRCNQIEQFYLLLGAKIPKFGYLHEENRSKRPLEPEERSDNKRIKYYFKENTNQKMAELQENFSFIGTDPDYSLRDLIDQLQAEDLKEFLQLRFAEHDNQSSLLLIANYHSEDFIYFFNKCLSSCKNELFKAIYHRTNHDWNLLHYLAKTSVLKQLLDKIPPEEFNSLIISPHKCEYECTPLHYIFESQSFEVQQKIHDKVSIDILQKLGKFSGTLKQSLMKNTNLDDSERNILFNMFEFKKTEQMIPSVKPDCSINTVNTLPYQTKRSDFLKREEKRLKTNLDNTHERFKEAINKHFSRNLSINQSTMTRSQTTSVMTSFQTSMANCIPLDSSPIRTSSSNNPKMGPTNHQGQLDSKLLGNKPR